MFLLVGKDLFHIAYSPVNIGGIFQKGTAYTYAIVFIREYCSVNIGVEVDVIIDTTVGLKILGLAFQNMSSVQNITARSNKDHT